MSTDALRSQKLQLLRDDNEVMRSWSMYRCLILEVDLGDGFSYHFSDGVWYKVASSLVDELRQFLDVYWSESTLPEYSDQNEGEYNERVGELEGFVCLDKTNISPRRQTQIEPCDLLLLRDGRAEFIHVKIGTSSSTLSHLFNQGANSVQLLRTEDASVGAVRDLISSKADRASADEFTKAVDSNNLLVTYAIVTHKREFSKKSDNLPFFSRISLRRQLTTLRSMQVQVTFQFVRDHTDRAGKPKTRKTKAPEQSA